MTPAELSRTVLHAVRRAVDRGELSVAVPERAVVAPPGAGGRGDWATNVALQLARPAGRPPRHVAEVLLPHLRRAEGVADVAITGPGFLNISLDAQAGPELVARVLREGPRYGHCDALAGQAVTVRVPHEVRAETVADAVARIVASQGGRVHVEHGEPATLRPVPAPEDPVPLGPDAARWALLHPAPHDRPRITADHLVQRESNPLFRVRYAHARTRAAARNAADLGFHAEPGALDPAASATSAAPLTPPGPAAPPTPAALATADAAGPGRLEALLADHPRVLAAAAARHAPDRLARHLVAVADATVVLLPGVLPRGEEKPSAAHRARLALAEAAGTVLAGGLTLLGIDAPDHL